jgi:hypothetical protein
MFIIIIIVPLAPAAIIASSVLAFQPKLILLVR